MTVYGRPFRSHRLADAVARAEQLLRRVGADDRHAQRLVVVGEPQQRGRARRRSSGCPGTAARSPLTFSVAALKALLTVMPPRCSSGLTTAIIRRLALQRPHIVDRQQDRPARTFAAGLHATSVRPRRCRRSCPAPRARAGCRAGILRRWPTARPPRSRPRGSRTSSGSCGACWRAGSTAPAPGSSTMA